MATLEEVEKYLKEEVEYFHAEANLSSDDYLYGVERGLRKALEALERLES